MFRTVWLENPAVAWAEDVPDIGLAAQEATHLAADPDEDEDDDEDDADAGTTATTPRASAMPPKTATSRLAPVLMDDSDFNT
jgi:hypothetical protein